MRTLQSTPPVHLIWKLPTHIFSPEKKTHVVIRGKLVRWKDLLKTSPKGKTVSARLIDCPVPRLHVDRGHGGPGGGKRRGGYYGYRPLQ